MKVYKPVSDREVARRLSVTTINSAYYYLPIIQEIFGLGLVICERTDRPQGWIPCSERLPEEDKDVLAWVESTHDARIACCNYAKGVWFDAIMDVIVKPIAWMPLPEPWKGADDEYDAVINAAYVIYSFLKDHEETSGTAFWKSNIDGTILTTDWGYFEEGLEQIKMYCERLAEGSRR